MECYILIDDYSGFGDVFVAASFDKEKLLKHPSLFEQHSEGDHLEWKGDTLFKTTVGIERLGIPERLLKIAHIEVVKHDTF